MSLCPNSPTWHNNNAHIETSAHTLAVALASRDLKSFASARLLRVSEACCSDLSHARNFFQSCSRRKKVVSAERHLQACQI